jgi:hypothetical protein
MVLLHNDESAKDMNDEQTALLAQAHRQIEMVKRRTVTLTACMKSAMTNDTLGQFHGLYSEALGLEETLELMSRAARVPS